MRILTIIILITLYVQNVYSYELYLDEEGHATRWYTDTIDVYLDPSLEKIAPADKIYSIIEESFLEWNDYVEDDISINFIREACLFSSKSCVSYGYCEVLGTANITKSNNKISQVDIRIGDNTNWGMPGEKDKIDIKPILLHEIGHFWGLAHASDINSIMYPYPYSSMLVLTEDDINGITDLYTNSKYISEPEEDIDYQFMGCSINNIDNATKGILSLLF
jgi:hypothetical protein